jgi:hypothetical protein
MRFCILKQGTIMVIIEFNNTGLGKARVVKCYDNIWLLRSCPYDRLEEIHLQGFTLREITKWHTKNY